MNSIISNLNTFRVSIHAMYYKIACEQATLYRERDKERVALEQGPCPEEEDRNFAGRLQQCYEQRKRCAVIAVTFAAMALEAFFYNYAAEQFGDNLAADIDPLNLPARFLVYPRLSCGKGPDKSAEAFGCVRRLTTLRNKLVHFKSKGFPLERITNAADFHDELDADLEAGVDNAIRCIPLVLAELDNLHGTGPNYANSMKWTE
jgi:hypothetical protein